MKRSFLDYLNSRDSFDRFKFSAKEYNKGLLFGLEYYDYLCSDLDKGEIPDIRMYHILHDHKKLMKCRIEYLIGQGEWNSGKLAELDSRNDSLILETEVLRNSAIKYNMSPTEKVRGNIKNRIVNLKNLDAKFMSDFLDIL